MCVYERERERVGRGGGGEGVVSHTNIGPASKTTLGKLLTDGMEHIWAFSSA